LLVPCHLFQLIEFLAFTMEAVCNTTYRVFVSGLARGPTQRVKCGSAEEGHLGDLFLHHGCVVADVQLMVNMKNGFCRGFAFVCFEDEASLKLALELNGHPSPANVWLTKASDERLSVEKAMPLIGPPQNRQRDLSEACGRWASEALLRDLERKLLAQGDRQVDLISHLKSRCKVDRTCASDDSVARVKNAIVAMDLALDAIDMAVAGFPERSGQELGAFESSTQKCSSKSFITSSGAEMPVMSTALFDAPCGNPADDLSDSACDIGSSLTAMALFDRIAESSIKTTMAVNVWV